MQLPTPRVTALLGLLGTAFGLGAGWWMGQHAPASQAPTELPDREEAEPRDEAQPQPATRTPVASPGEVAAAEDALLDERPVPTTEAPTSCTPWVEELARARQAAALHQRASEACSADARDEHGEPIATPEEVSPRFTQEAIQAALTQAIADARAPGSQLQGMDCSESPCIAFGRLAGTEETLERVERSRALSAYRRDVQTALLWMAFGGETGDTNVQVDEEEAERAEVGFFAMAFYTQNEAARMGESIDRRVRSRTAALWNAIRPTDTLSPGDAP